MRFFLIFATIAASAAPTAAFTTITGIARGAPASSSSVVLHAESATADINGADKKKIIILGGDGFCGWPTSLYLSDQGHDVVIVDNLSRRNIDTEMGCDSLTPIQSPDVSTVGIIVDVSFIIVFSLRRVFGHGVSIEGYS
jgi:UDP-sulfoquinovose synthase